MLQELRRVPAVLLMLGSVAITVRATPDPVKLNGSLPEGGQVEQFRISPDGRRVLYWADGEVEGRIELYSVAIEGGVVTRLNGVLPPGVQIANVEITLRPTRFTLRRVIPTDSASNARCGLRPGRNPYEKPRKSIS